LCGVHERFSAKNLKFDVSPTPNFQESSGNSFSLITSGLRRFKTAFTTPYGVEISLNSIVVFSVLKRNTGLTHSLFLLVSAGFCWFLLVSDLPSRD
jgi:hypothetical protein